MKIIFTSSNTNSPSFIFYANSLAKINGMKDNISIEIKKHSQNIDYSEYDAALIMGFDNIASKVKLENPSILVGVVEPRSAQRNFIKNVDFIIVNSIEAKDFFIKNIQDILIYYTFPEVLSPLKCPLKKDRLVLGYHGNIIHLDAMYPRITDAIATLSKEIPLELWAMYNIEALGKWKKPDLKDLGFPIVHIQYSEENYARYMAHVDIGIVPQLIPVKENRILRYLIGSLGRKYYERSDNYFLRFKPTTNIGRHLIFAQYGVPIVCDMTPSSCAFIKDEIEGFIVYHTEGWLRALKKLAINNNKRIEMGKRLNEKYLQVATHEKMNKNLIMFIKELISEK